MHVLLAPADCMSCVVPFLLFVLRAFVLTTCPGKKVFEAGWGQRHALSGVGLPKALGGNLLMLPAEYVFLYAPRTQDELVLVMDIVRASVAYMTNSDEVH